MHTQQVSTSLSFVLTIAESGIAIVCVELLMRAAKMSQDSYGVGFMCWQSRCATKNSILDLRRVVGWFEGGRMRRNMGSADLDGNQMVISGV